MCFSESIVVEDPRPRALVLWLCARVCALPACVCLSALGVCVLPACVCVVCSLCAVGVGVVVEAWPLCSRALVVWLCAPAGACGVVVCVRILAWCVVCACVRVVCALVVCALGVWVGVGMRVPPTLVFSWLGGGVGGVLFLCGCVVAVSYSPTTCRSQYHWRYRA